MPHYRTPGGHRRFRAADLRAVLVSRALPGSPSAAEALVQQVVGHTRQRLAAGHLAEQPWRVAFAQEEPRQQMREMGRRTMALAIQYVGSQYDPAPLLAEGRRVGEWYGERCAERGVSLADTARSFCFFRTSLLQATSPNRLGEGAADTEQVHTHTRLGAFLDEVMFACLTGYELACRRLRPPGSAA